MKLDDIKEILALVREHDLAEIELERDGLKVRIRKADRAVAIMPPTTPMTVVAPAAPTAVPGSPGGPVPAAAGPADIEEGVELAVIKSPIVGTFYRSPEPGARSFVEVGDDVRKGQVLCIIEAMKLMNEIECDCDGQLAAVYVENGKPVQFGDRLFAVKVA
jgi:acetyl-CoA carboxylase biotin carboxyl carrier protein